MEKKKVTIGSPVTVSGVTLIPVSEVSINYWRGKPGVALSGSTHPVSVVIVSSSAKRAFRITGEEITIDQLAREAPDIRKVLRKL